MYLKLEYNVIYQSDFAGMALTAVNSWRKLQSVSMFSSRCAESRIEKCEILDLTMLINGIIIHALL